MVVMIIGRAGVSAMSAGLILVERRNPMIAQCPSLPSPWWGARSLALTSHMQARFQIVRPCSALGWPSFADDAPVRACVSEYTRERNGADRRCRTMRMGLDTTAAEARRKRHATEIRHLWTSPRWEWHRHRHMHAAPWFVFASPSARPPAWGPLRRHWQLAPAAVTVTGRSAHWERAFREGSFARPGPQKPAWAAFGAGFKQKAECLSACCQRHCRSAGQWAVILRSSWRFLAVRLGGLESSTPPRRLARAQAATAERAGHDQRSRGRPARRRL